MVKNMGVGVTLHSVKGGDGRKTMLPEIHLGIEAIGGHEIEGATAGVARNECA
jgi:hypothetical protein